MTHKEYRVYYGEYRFECFARNTDDAIEQCNEQAGESFKVSDISEIKVATDKGWQNVPLPVFRTIN